MSQTLSGKLSICRTSSGEIKIYLIDESSGCEIVDLAVSPHDFAEALTGMSHRPCEIEWRTANLGKKHEHKTEEVPIPKDFPYRTHAKFDAAADAALAAFEVEGWKADRSCLSNGHCRTDGGYRVSFHRYVPQPAPSTV